MMLDRAGRSRSCAKPAKRAMNRARTLTGLRARALVFRQLFARAHAPQRALPPIPDIQEKPRAQAREYDPSNWKDRDDKRHATIAKLRASVEPIERPLLPEAKAAVAPLFDWCRIPERQ